MNGLDALIAIRGEFPFAKVIVLTTYTGDVQVLRALKAGDPAYLLKNLLHRELLETVRAVHEGKKSLSAEASYELAQHALDDALTLGEGRDSEVDRSRKCKQANRVSTFDYRGDCERPCQEHSLQIECQRSYPRRDDRPEARNHRNLKLKRVRPRPFLGFWTGKTIA
jgi:YesN/AraC family two-component response regulator